MAGVLWHLALRTLGGSPTSSLYVQLPELVGAKAQVIAEPHPQQEDVAAWCAERSGGQHLNRSDDNRWDEPNENLINVAERIAEIHYRTGNWTYPTPARPGAAEVVFCDGGVPNLDGSASVYSTLTDLLVAEASPAATSPGSMTSPTRTASNEHRQISHTNDLTDPC